MKRKSIVIQEEVCGRHGQGAVRCENKACANGQPFLEPPYMVPRIKWRTRGGVQKEREVYLCMYCRKIPDRDGFCRIGFT